MGRISKWFNNIFGDHREIVNKEEGQREPSPSYPKTPCISHNESYEGVKEEITVCPPPGDIIQSSDELVDQTYPDISYSQTTCRFKKDNLDILVVSNEPLTLDNTVGIRTRKTKKGIKYDAYLYIYINKNTSHTKRLGSYDTIEEAWQARLNYIIDKFL